MNKIYLIFLFTFAHLSFGALVQMKDFLCGCDYCETVNRQEPLDIGGHMMRCHSWKKGMQKTMEEMRKGQDVKATPAITTPPPQKIPSPRSVVSPNHKWQFNFTHGWVYSNPKEPLHLYSGWIYREDLKWVWLFERNKFMYSPTHGWLFNLYYLNHSFIYWYDRRAWTLAPHSKK